MRCVNDIDSQDCTPAHVAITSLRHEVPDTQAKAVHQRKTTFLRRASARHTGVDGANIASALWLVRAIASVLWPGRAFASDLWLERADQPTLGLVTILAGPPNFGEAPTLCGTGEPTSDVWLCHHTSGHCLILAKRLHYVALIGIKSLRGSNCQIATIRATIQMAPS